MTEKHAAGNEHPDLQAVLGVEASTVQKTDAEIIHALQSIISAAPGLAGNLKLRTKIDALEADGSISAKDLEEIRALASAAEAGVKTPDLAVEKKKTPLPADLTVLAAGAAEKLGKTPTKQEFMNFASQNGFAVTGASWMTGIGLSNGTSIKGGTSVTTRMQARFGNEIAKDSTKHIMALITVNGSVNHQISTYREMAGLGKVIVLGLAPIKGIANSKMREKALKCNEEARALAAEFSNVTVVDAPAAMNSKGDGDYHFNDYGPWRKQLIGAMSAVSGGDFEGGGMSEKEIKEKSEAFIKVVKDSDGVGYGKSEIFDEKGELRADIKDNSAIKELAESWEKEKSRTKVAEMGDLAKYAQELDVGGKLSGKFPDLKSADPEKAKVAQEKLKKHLTDAYGEKFPGLKSENPEEIQKALDGIKNEIKTEYALDSVKGKSDTEILDFVSKNQDAAGNHFLKTDPENPDKMVVDFESSGVDKNTLGLGHFQEQIMAKYQYIKVTPAGGGSPIYGYRTADTGGGKPGYKSVPGGKYVKIFHGYIVEGVTKDMIESPDRVQKHGLSDEMVARLGSAGAQGAKEYFTAAQPRLKKFREGVRKSSSVTSPTSQIGGETQARREDLSPGKAHLFKEDTSSMEDTRVQPDLKKIFRAAKFAWEKAGLVEGVHYRVNSVGRSEKSHRANQKSGTSGLKGETLSKHCYGAAFDVVMLDAKGNDRWGGPKVKADRPKYLKMGNIYKQQAQKMGIGVKWGGDWKGQMGPVDIGGGDPFHFELDIPVSKLKQMAS